MIYFDNGATTLMKPPQVLWAVQNAMISTSANRATAKITVPEGYDCDQIFDLLAQKGVCTKEALENAAANDKFDYSFLSGIEYGEKNRLEGYLFPDTYEFYQNESAHDIVHTLYAAFDAKITDAMRWW